MNIPLEAARGTDEILNLPISVVTEQMGTKGLRIRFAREVMQAFVDPYVLEMAGRAYDLGSGLHRNDRRSHEPVENHLLRGAIRVLSSDHLDYKDPFMPAIMLLHDSPEDHPHQLANVRKNIEDAEARIRAFGRLAADFAPEVSDGVRWMTNPLPQIGKTSLALYLEHGHMLVAHGPARSIIGKFADFFDNGTGIFWSREATPEQFMKWADKYIQFAPILENGLSRPDLGLGERATRYAETQFKLTSQHCARVIMKNGVRADFLSLH